MEDPSSWQLQVPDPQVPDACMPLSKERKDYARTVQWIHDNPFLACLTVAPCHLDSAQTAPMSASNYCNVRLLPACHSFFNLSAFFVFLQYS